MAYIISRAAGYEFDRERRKYVTKYGQIQTGQCCVTSAGDLHYKCVIHCVGPRLQEYQNKGVCAAVLRGAIVNVLHLANTRNLKSVGIPSISSGIYPMELIKLGKGWFDYKPVKHSSWMAVYSPTDHPKFACNRCVMEHFDGIFCVVTLLY